MKRKAQQQQEEEEYYRPTHESAVYTVSTQYDFKDNPKINSIGRSQSQEHNLIKKTKRTPCWNPTGAFAFTCPCP